MLGRKHFNKYAAKADVQWLVAGLGNPGPKYQGSPHNVGFAVVDQLSIAHRISLTAKHDGMFGTGKIGESDIALVEPLTFMNLSGRSVKPTLRALDLTPDRLIVVHDEIDLPYGAVQVKIGGGLAGHNGLRSISELLGTREYTRVRIGVGRPDSDDRRPIADWILVPFSRDLDVESLYIHGATAVERIIELGPIAAQNAVNGPS
ncbi:MAG: aminoacyl-tRNA hydrolase [Thermoleophilia bacterium]|nr:aminoacyl-tRNA hydrolase [Thermoleophilia bacterium]